jgi:RNA polymerase subunit RPABC4/transcription elongation factor Spt4
MRCKYCNADIEQEAQFCPNCGKDLSKFNRCVNCGELLDRDTEFCPYCGTKQSLVGQNQHEDLTDTLKPYEKKSSKKWIWFVVLLILLALIGGGGYWYYSQNSNQIIAVVDTDSIEVPTDSLINDPVAVEAAESRQAIMEGSVELDAEETLQNILSTMINSEIDSNVEMQNVNKYFTADYRTYFNRACEKADKEGYEHPKVWWQYSDDDPKGFIINSVNYISDEKVNANVTLKGELYSGTYEIILVSVDCNWLIDSVTEKEFHLLE